MICQSCFSEEVPKGKKECAGCAEERRKHEQFEREVANEQRKKTRAEQAEADRLRRRLEIRLRNRARRRVGPLLSKTKRR